MSKENAKFFYQKFVTDKELQRQVAEGKENPKQHFVDVAKTVGYDFTIKELEEVVSNMTVAEVEKMTASDIVTKDGICYCFLSGAGVFDNITCACVAGGGGTDGRCVCVLAGAGS